MDDRPSRPPQQAPTKPHEPMPAPVSRRWPIYGTIIGLVALVALAWWMQAAPTPQTRVNRSNATAIPVVADIAAKSDVNITINALGTVTSVATVTILSQISGRVMRINFHEGQIVKEGDLLVEIDSRPYELALSQWQGQLKHDEALLADARIDLARYQKLAATNAIPEQQLDTQAWLVKQYEGTVVSDQAQVDTAKLNIAYCHIVAPVNGRVGLRLVDVGNYVSPTNTTGIVVLTQLQPITVVFPVAEDNVPQVLERLHANAVLPVSAYDRSGTTKLASGKVIAIDSQIDTTTGTLKIKAQFANDDETLFPNQFVNVQLLVDVLHGATVVPTSAIQRGASGAFVYLVNSDDTVTARPVKLGPSSGDHVAVSSGLALGDRVVVDGADKLHDGAEVVLRDTSGSSVAGPANTGNAGKHKPPQRSP